MKQCRTDCIHAEACRRYADNSTYWQSGDCSIYKPTADVVPKSEVEALEKELANAYKELDEAGNFYCSFTKSKIQNCPIDDEVAKAKQEVAREIFEEIEKHTQKKKKAISMFKDGEDDFYDGEIHALDVFEHFLAELKKKYTESEGKV